MTKVKICGITNLDDARYAVARGADSVGFNFYARSPRYIAPDAARDIIVKVGDEVTTVGVFVNENLDETVRIALDCKIDAIQLHGDESPQFAKQAKQITSLSVIKAFRVGKDFDIESIADYDVEGILIDAFVPALYGGSGQSANLATAQIIAKMHSFVYLAGGLTPKNVADAILTVRPFAVDVASGVESFPGKKDHEKVAEFIDAAKGAL
jgi:phosphoribosylanthranilate isomerase